VILEKRNEQQSFDKHQSFQYYTYHETRKSTHHKLRKFVGKRKNLSISAPSVPAEQLSMSVLAELLNVIEVGVKKYTL